MLLRTTVAIAIVAVLCTLGRARAQDDTNDGAPRVVTSGCWQGNVFNDAQGTGTITFFFEISKSGKVAKSGSTYVINYDEGLTEMASISGKVTSTQFSFKGKAVGNQGSKCTISGKASPVQGETFLDGSYRYTGKCTEVSGPNNPFTGGDIGKLEFVGPNCL
jgi:hypothetical protein